MLTGSAATRVVDSLDGTRDRAQVLAAARSAGVGDDAAERVLVLLTERGMLDDAATDTRPLRELPLAERDRMEPDLLAVSLTSGKTDAGMSVLRQRRCSSVHVYGAGRTGAAVASLLASSGVGKVHPIDPDPAGYADVAPAALQASDVGTLRERAAAAAVQNAAPSTRTDDAAPPDLAVLVPASGADLTIPDTLLQQRVPHLSVTVREARAIVGPLVLPGETACLRCQHLHRADRDPAWPRLAAQLTGSHEGASTSAVVLSTAVAAASSTQALAYLDDPEGPLPTLDGSLELLLPDWQWHRRSWPPHPHCGCRWDD